MGIEFTAEQRERIASALAEQVGITDPAKQTAFIDYIGQTGSINGFGAGSLLTYSHLQNGDGTPQASLLEDFPTLDHANLTQTTPAVLGGFKRDFVCYDIFYRGTEEKPGITLGLEADPEGKTNGGVLKTSLEGMSPEVATAFTVKYLELFREREFPPNMPIYTFDVAEVEQKDGTRVQCLACVADQDGPLYIHNVDNRYAMGDPESPYYFEKGDVEARARWIAAAYGPTHNPLTGEPKAAGKVTNLDYWRDLIKDSIAKGIPVERHMMQLDVSAVEMRRDMPEAERLALEALERKDDDSNTPAILPAFTAAVEAHNRSFENGDPAPAEGLEHD